MIIEKMSCSIHVPNMIRSLVMRLITTFVSTISYLKKVPVNFRAFNEGKCDTISIVNGKYNFITIN